MAALRGAAMLKNYGIKEKRYPASDSSGVYRV